MDRPIPQQPEGSQSGDEMGLGFLLPLFSCENEARRLDEEILVLQVAASSPLVPGDTRARVAEAAEAWRAFRRKHGGFGGCFGRAAIHQVGLFTALFEQLLRDVEQDSLRSASVAPTPAVITPPVTSPPVPVLTNPAGSPKRGGRAWFWGLMFVGGATLLGYRAVKARQR